jgi:hypothetical protein
MRRRVVVGRPSRRQAEAAAVIERARGGRLLCALTANRDGDRAGDQAIVRQRPAGLRLCHGFSRATPTVPDECKGDRAQLRGDRAGQVTDRLDRPCYAVHWPVGRNS